MMISSIIFIALLLAASLLFAKNVKTIIRNIKLGKELDRSDRKGERFKLMAKVALGQSKMVVRPVSGLLHILVYVGFVIINIEVLEIVLDGILGEHRLFSFLGSFYYFLIASFEILALLVLLACVIFLIRRNVIRLKRFSGVEMTSWPKSDANYILITEILLMSAFLFMNAADLALQNLGSEHYVMVGTFPISGILVSLVESMNESSLIVLERSLWWFHIVGILLS